MDGIELVYLCECAGEGMSVASWDDGNEVCLAIWRLGDRRRSLSNRLRHAWYCLRYGTPYLDDIVLGPEKALGLAEAIKGAVAPETE